MKLIPLSQGKLAMVDDEDYDFLNQWKWYAYLDRKTWYARRSKNGGKIIMHRAIMEVSDTKQLIDHVDGDGLNNQRLNLRKCTPSQNQRNKRPNTGTASQYKGVTICLSTKKNRTYKYWRARIVIDNKKELCLGVFPYNNEGEIAAAKKYDEAQKEHYKEFARLNFPDQ